MKKILVVDDNEMNLEISSTILADNGYLVIEAKDGFEAINKYNNEDSIDLILLDIMMPGMDGYEVARLIRENDKETPILAFTANSSLADRQKIFESGMNDCVYKPVEVDILLRKIKDLIKK